MQKCLPFIMYYGSAWLLFTRKVHCLQTFWQVTAHRVIGPYLGTNFRPASLTVFEILGFKLKNENKTIFKLAVGVCCCLQTCNSVANMLVMGLVLGQSLMVISTMVISCYMQKYLSFIMYYGSVLLLFTHKLHGLQTF